MQTIYVHFLLGIENSKSMGSNRHNGSETSTINIQVGSSTCVSVIGSGSIVNLNSLELLEILGYQGYLVYDHAMLHLINESAIVVLRTINLHVIYNQQAVLLLSKQLINDFSRYFGSSWNGYSFAGWFNRLLGIS